MTGSSPHTPIGSWLRLGLLLVLLAAFALRLHALTRQNIWWDEARNIDVALRSLTEIATAPELDIQPPLYFWLLHGWGQLSGMTVSDAPERTAFLARFFSVAAGLVATALLAPLARRISGPMAAPLAVILAVLSPFWLAESQEARMYTLSFALLTGAAWMWGARKERVKGRRGEGVRGALFPFTPSPPLALFVILSALALMTHYNAVFVLVAWYGWWGGWALVQPDRWRQLRTVLLCGLAMTLLCAPLAPLALRQIPTYANPNLTIPTLATYLIQNWQAVLAGYAFDPALLAGFGRFWLWLVLAIFVAGMGAFVTHLSQIKTATPPTPLIGLLVVWVIGTLGLYYGAVLDRGAFNVRYSSFVTPALYVLLAGGLAALGRLWRPLMVLGLGVVTVGMLPALSADLYDPRFAREDIAGVTGWLRTVAGPNDLILVDQKYPFGFYYERYAIDPAVTPRGAEAAPARYLFVDINTLDARLTGWAGTAQQVFWVQWFESDTDPRHAVPFLLDKVGRRVGSQAFQGYSIDWWALEPPNHFELAPALTPMRFTFPPVAETVAVSLPGVPLGPGAPVPVVIRWQRVPDGIITRPYKVRVALYDAAEARLAQSDERLLNDRHVMPGEWAQSDQPLNVYLLAPPADMPTGMYELRVLVYDAETLEPLTLVDGAGNPAGQEATLGTVVFETDGVEEKRDGG